MEIEYEKYKRLIYKRAWIWARKTGMDVEELIAEGNLVFAIKVKEYDEEKSCFSTFLYRSLELHFLNLFNYQKTRRHNAVDGVEFLPAKNNTGDNVILMDFLEKKSSESAKKILILALNPPPDFIDCVKKRNGGRVNKASIQDYWRAKGGSISECWRAFAELKETLSMI